MNQTVKNIKNPIFEYLYRRSIEEGHIKVKNKEEINNEPC